MLVGAIGEIEKVSQVFHPASRFSAANSPTANVAGLAAQDGSVRMSLTYEQLDHAESAFGYV